MQLKNKIVRVAGLLKKHGWLGLLIKAEEKSTEPVNLRYREQYPNFLPKESELEKERETAFCYLPKISIVVPAYRTPENFLTQLITSVREQTYSNWELCIADGSPDEQVQEIVRNFQKQDARIRYERQTENGGISANTNAGIRMAEGEYIGLLDHDDVLSPNALFAVVERLNQETEKEKRPQLLYSDEDKVTEDLTEHFEPHFKSGYNEELLHRYNYICHFVVFHRSLVQKAGFLGSSYDGAQDYDFLLRCTEVLPRESIVHIPKILYHWRVHEASTASSSASKDYSYEAGKRAVEAHLKRTKRAAHVESAKGREFVKVTYENAKEQEVTDASYIIKQGKGIQKPSKNWQENMQRYFRVNRSSTEQTNKNVENPFKIGMVCGKLIRLSRVSSCGYTFDNEGNVYPLFRGEKLYHKGYYRRAVVPQNISAGSLLFCMIDREAYEKVGGFDRNLPSPYRDLDFAFRLRKAGYQVVLDPSISAYCKEEEPDEAEMEKAKKVLQERWSAYLKEGDPYYNPNLSLGKETFRLRETKESEGEFQ